MPLVKIISDLSGTICNEQIPIEWVLYHAKRKFRLITKAAINYMHWLKDKNPSHFYKTLEGLPLRDFGFLKNLTPNKNWDKMIRDKKPKRVGFITQDDLLVANAYLKTQKQRFEDLGIEVVMLEFNFAKYKKGFYTGEVELNVTPHTLPNLL
ncbi:unnamed protein product, partial [marine sediment metagenome]